MTPIQNHAMRGATVAVSLSIKDVPEEVLERLRARAERNHRSLQGELLAIVEAAAFEESEITVDELARYVSRIGLSTPDESAGWIRELRDNG
ncbi:MAG: Arc family DNA-binding protein [Actinomycetia bacterium]|nr:Arc family DNA-binding protein [Actinomycetes bacterium]